MKQNVTSSVKGFAVFNLAVLFLIVGPVRSLKAQQTAGQTERVRQARVRLERAEARLSKVYDELSAQYSDLKSTKGTDFFRAVEDAIRKEATSEDVAAIQQEARKKLIDKAGKSVLEEQITKRLIPSIESHLADQGLPSSVVKELAPHVAQEMAGRIVETGFSALDAYQIGWLAARDVVLVKRNLAYNWKYFFEGLPAKGEYEAALTEYRAALEEAMNTSAGEESPPLSNLASQAEVFASSEYTPDYVASRATDGDLSTSWLGIESTGEWLKLVWPHSVTVSKVVVYNRTKYAGVWDPIDASTLMFSDGSQESVPAMTGYLERKEITFPPKSITWMRFQIDKAPGRASRGGLAEIEVYSR